MSRLFAKLHKLWNFIYRPLAIRIQPNRMVQLGTAYVFFFVSFFFLSFSSSSFLFVNKIRKNWKLHCTIRIGWNVCVSLDSFISNKSITREKKCIRQCLIGAWCTMTFHRSCYCLLVSNATLFIPNFFLLFISPMLKTTGQFYSYIQKYIVYYCLFCADCSFHINIFDAIKYTYSIIRFFFLLSCFFYCSKFGFFMIP